MAPLRTFYTLEIPPSRAARCFLATLLSPHRGRPPGGGSRPAAPHRLAPAPADERPAADARCAARFCAGGRAADLESGRGRGGGGRLVAPLSCRCPPRRSRRSRRKAGFDCHLLGARESAAGGGGGSSAAARAAPRALRAAGPKFVQPPARLYSPRPHPLFLSSPNFPLLPLLFVPPPPLAQRPAGPGARSATQGRRNALLPSPPPEAEGGTGPSARYLRASLRGACPAPAVGTRTPQGFFWGGGGGGSKPRPS